MRRVMLLLALALPLGACADDVTSHDNGRWLVTRRAGETDYEARDGILFGIDSAQISTKGYDLIANVASEARRNRRSRIQVEGHTDTAGNHDYNMTLSQARAEKVADVLVHQGVAPERILARGYGETQPAVHTRDGVKEPRNRRVVIRLFNS